MSTADTVILLHQHLDWRLNDHIQNNKPLVYQRSVIVPRWQSMESFWGVTFHLFSAAGETRTISLSWLQAVDGSSSPVLELSFTLCDNHVCSASSVNNVPCLIVANKYFVTVTYICKSFNLRVNTCYILFININYKFQYFPPWTELRRIRSLYASITCAVRLLSTMCYAWL